MSRTFKDMTPGVRPQRREQERRLRNARQVSMRFATSGKIARVGVPRDVFARLEVHVPVTATNGSRRVLDGEQFRALTEVLSEHPELTADRLRELVRSQDSKQRRSRAEAVRPRTAGEIVQLLEAKVITRAEARRFMRLK